MPFKLETKEKFYVATLSESDLSASLTDKTVKDMEELLNTDVKNLILCLKFIVTADESSCDILTSLQSRFYGKNASFVICEVNPNIEKILKNPDLPLELNIVPTESEAWDIVQMEEIEREFLNDEM